MRLNCYDSRMKSIPARVNNDIRKYQHAVIATDIVLFAIRNDRLHVLLIAMKKAPFEGMWASPGGLVGPNESLEDAAHRHLAEKTMVQNVYLEQLATFGHVNRDPFGRVVSVAYMAIIASDRLHLATTSEYGDVRWYPTDALPKLAYDHKEIITAAVERIRAKLGYTNIVYGAMPRYFTLTELQRVYEIILRRTIDKRNFRKKILSLGLLKKTNHKASGLRHRPAELYEFAVKKPQTVNIMKM